MKTFTFLFMVILSVSASATVVSKCEDRVFDYLGATNGPLYKKIALLQDAAERAEGAGNHVLERKLRTQAMEILNQMQDLTEITCK